MRLQYIALASLLLLAGCSGGKDEEAAASGGRDKRDTPAAAQVVPPRREFMVVREIVRQHGLQQGDEKRMEAVETALKVRFPQLPNHGQTDEEREIYRDAATLFERLR